MPGKRKWTDFSLPGYKYLGPGNALDKGPPNNVNDVASLYHDVRYGDIAHHGGNPYLQWSDADQKWLEDTNAKDYGGVLGKAWFGAKRLAYGAGILSKTIDERPRAFTANDATVLGGKEDVEPFPFKFSNVRDASLLNLQQSSQDQTMSEGTPVGSGNAAGLTETPIDRVRDVQRGPRDHVFASLPYVQDIRVSQTVWAFDLGYRMTSPYDPSMSLAAAVDQNTGAGTATTQTVVALDSSDVAITSARWFDFYSTLYNYYHTVGCRYHITIENLKLEPAWCHLMFCNDEIPPPTATNEDIMCWNDVESHYLGAHALGTISAGSVATNEMPANLNNVEGNGTAGNTGNYNSSNHVQSRGQSPILKLSGTYRTGQTKRQIHLDSEVENWTAINANPALPERLLLRFKPYWNAIDTNDANTYDRAINVRVKVQLEYLVEFKELKFGLRWPIERQPVICAVNVNVEEDEE